MAPALGPEAPQPLAEGAAKDMGLIAVPAIAVRTGGAFGAATTAGAGPPTPALVDLAVSRIGGCVGM